MDVLDLLSANHETLQPLFVYSESDITLYGFLEKIEFEEGNENTRSFFMLFGKGRSPEAGDNCHVTNRVLIFAAWKN